MSKLTVVIAAYNEEENIEKVVFGVLKVMKEYRDLWEIVIVDDGSQDCTPKITDHLLTIDNHIRVFHHEKNRGYEAAFRTGWENAKGEIIVLFDADLQYDPLDILKTVTKLEEGYDIAVGWRKRREERKHRLILSRGLNFMTRILFGLPIHDIDGKPKAIRKEVFNKVAMKFKGWMVDTELIARARYEGFRISEIEVKHYRRISGKSKVSMVSTFKVFLDLISLRLSLIH